MSGETMTRLEGKVAIITGAASGIGKCAAQHFAAEGASVVVADRDEEGAKAVSADIIGAGGSAIAVQVDVSVVEEVGSLMATAVSKYGKIDILYNNAGGSRPDDGTVVDVDIEVFWKTIQVDLLGTFLGCRFAIPYMQKQGGGAIVNMVSNVAFMGIPGVDCYTAAKGGVVALTRSLAVTYAKDRIRVNAIAPSTTLTPRIIERMRTSETTRRIASKNLLGSPEPIDIARAAMFLASDDARVMTGTILLADSGSTIS
jgi:NAD(P)-dependent dehydrogenase (short-subunit alcohol dehydrogenase family)